MEAKEFRELVRSLFKGNIKGTEYDKLFFYLAGILKRQGGNRLPRNEIPEVTRGFIVKLYAEKDKFMNLMEDPAGLRAYIGVTAKNFLCDYFRLKNRDKAIPESEIDPNIGKRPEYINRVPDLKIIRKYELLELEDVFNKKVKPEEIKYFCYLYDSKRYKCLWGDKSDDAIYKDVSRKKHIVEEFGEEIKKLRVSEELMEEFIKNKLSEICEKLRSEICKEASNDAS